MRISPIGPPDTPPPSLHAWVFYFSKVDKILSLLYILEMKEMPKPEKRREIYIYPDISLERIRVRIGSADDVVFGPKGNSAEIISGPEKELSTPLFHQAIKQVSAIFKRLREKEKERNELLTEADKQRIIDDMQESAEERRDDMLPEE